MANTSSTPVSIFRAIELCALLLFRPSAFKAAQDEDNARLNSLPSPPEDLRHLVVRRALAYSLSLVVASAASGYASARLLALSFCPNAPTISWLQVAGSCILLWGTLFVRGWDIQTYGGVSLTERVNQWLYRFLFCLGTATLVYSLAWPACKVGA